MPRTPKAPHPSQGTEAEPHLRDAEASAALASIGDSVITTDTASAVTYLNAVAERLTGWSAAEAYGQPLDKVMRLVSEVSREPIPDQAARCLKEERAIDLEDGVVLLRRDGTEVPIGDSTAPVQDRLGQTIGVVIVIQDESEKRRVGRELAHEASHDPLTEMVNRREFERRLERVLAQLEDDEAPHALLCMDLDRFKEINDTGGHAAGDELLRNLGPLFRSHLRQRDTLARLGGDEFGVLLERCPLTQAERIAENLRAAVDSLRFPWAGQTFTLGASIGLTPLTPGIAGLSAAFKAADDACYAAKARGGNRVHLHSGGPVAS